MINETNFDIDSLLKEIEKKEILFSEELNSIILVGGLGTRLNPDRKKITIDHHHELENNFYGKVGPKAMALMNCAKENLDIKKIMTDWHLDIHAFCENIKKVTLSLGQESDIILDYYLKKHNNKYQHLELDFLIEKNPAGTLAPMIKLHQTNQLPTKPTVLANGDNIFDIDLFRMYLKGLILAHNINLDLNELVITLPAFVPWEESDAYGTMDIDFNSGLVRGFKEKSPISENVFIEIKNKKLTPVNSGISIITNPSTLIAKYLTEEIIETSNKLEQGFLEYKKNEKVVKYETLYEKLSKEKKMIAVNSSAYWTDLGTEEKLILAEKNIPNTNFFKKFY